MAGLRPCPPPYTVKGIRRVKVFQGQYQLFVEKNFDSRALLAGVFDYVTCQRSDGSIYGNGGATCKKGAPATREEIKKVIDVRNKIVSGNAASLLSDGVSKDALGPSISKSAIKDADQQISARANEIAEKMKKGEDLSKELNGFIKNRQFIGDPLTAEHLVLGIEEGTPKGMKAGKEYNEFLAKKMAINEYKNENTDREKRLAADVINGGVDKELDFHRKHAMALTTASGNTVSPSDVFMAGGKVAQVEARSVPASMEGKWELNGQKYAAKSGLNTRSEYLKNHTEAMDNNAVKRITEAVDKNPNLKTVVLAQRGNITEKVVADLASRPNARTLEFDYKVNDKGLVGKGQIIDPTGTGKPIIYNYGRSVSGFGKVNFDPYKSGSAFAAEHANLLSGKTSPITDNKVLKQRAKAEQRAEKRQAAEKARATRKNTSRSSSNNKSNAASKPAPAPKKAITQSQREQRKAQLEGMLAQAKKDRNSSFIAQLEGMLKAL